MSRDPATGRSTAAALAALLALAGIAAARASEALDGEPDTVLRTTVEAEEGSEAVIWLRPLEGAGEVRAEVRAQVRSGAIRFVLVDGDGEDVFDGEADKGSSDLSLSRTVDCAGGRCARDWKLVARFRGEGRWTLRAWGLAVVSGPEQPSAH